MTPRRHSCQLGFSLLEMSIVIAIIAVIISGGLVVFSGSLEKKQRDETRSRLQIIEKALYDFRMVNNRLPCPSDLVEALNATAGNNFGIEAANPGACTGGTPAANFTGGFGFVSVLGGVPTKTLKISDEYAFDGWGRRIVYAVSQSFTGDDAFTTFPASDTNPRITIFPDVGATTTISITAAYVLLSHGPNGHGALPRGSGTTDLNIVTSRIDADSPNTSELQNCDCDDDAVSTGFDTAFIQKEWTENPANPLDVFDDILVFGTRSTLRSPTE